MKRERQPGPAACRQLVVADPDQPPLCQNCRLPQTTSIEISQMVTHDGELVETPVLAIRHWCETCLNLIVAADWEALHDRKEPAA